MKIFLLFLFLVGFIYIFIRYLEVKSVFYPSREISLTPQQAGLGFEDVVVTASDGVKIHGWLVKNPAAKRNILFFHGNAGNISHRIDKIKAFYDMGFNIFIIDYRGYGKSGGKPTEDGLYMDSTAALEVLLKRSDIGRLPVIVYGESLGGVVAIDLAFRKKLAGLICDSSFTSANEMAGIYFPWAPRFMLSLRMDSINKVQGITSPKLFIHSRQDEIIPFWMGEKLFIKAAAPKELLELEGGHNDCFSRSEKKFKAGVMDFLKKYSL